jgi:tRNA nucleotidyltransferase/poly(A) polymerase
MIPDIKVKIAVVPESALLVVSRLQKAGHEAFFVGGCVRDLYRGIVPQDYDIVTSARPDEVCSLFSHTIPVGIRFGVLLVIEGGEKYEVATFRTEDGYVDGRRPAQIGFATAEEDVRRRDFTVNGLLFDPEAKRLIDHVDGCADIERRLIRTIGDPKTRFAEDHLRMLRAVRFAANLDYDLDYDALAAIQDQARDIHRISAERIRDELTKIVARQGARRGMELLDKTGLLGELLPEVRALRGIEQPERFHPEGDVWEHTLRMLAFLPAEGADPRLAWGVVMHDLGKAVTRSIDDRGVHFYGHVQRGEEIARLIMVRLKFSGSDMETILELIRCHMLFMNVKEMRPNRLKRFLRMPDFALHLELHRLDCMGSHGLLDNYEFCKAKLSETPEEELRPPRLITGNDLIGMGFTPGPLFSLILREVEDAQLNGNISSPEDARRLVGDRWGKPGSTDAIP